MIQATSPKHVMTDRILVVDDIADNSFLLQTILEEEGYQVEIADNGQIALKKVTSNPPDLILLDVMMPEMNGFEVTRYIRQNLALPYIPILLITGYTEPTARDGYDVGADGFIHKPINFDLLLDRIREILPPKT
jgi:CheY-like chemotaxis protein